MQRPVAAALTVPHSFIFFIIFIDQHFSHFTFHISHFTFLTSHTSHTLFFCNSPKSQKLHYLNVTLSTSTTYNILHNTSPFLAPGYNIFKYFNAILGVRPIYLCNSTIIRSPPRKFEKFIHYRATVLSRS